MNEDNGLSEVQKEIRRLRRIENATYITLSILGMIFMIGWLIWGWIAFKCH